MTELDPDSNLQINDTIEMGDMLHGHMGVYTIVAIVGTGVYQTNAIRRGAPIYIRRAQHKAGKEEGLFVFVEKNEKGRWVRCETGPATEWAVNPKRAK